MGVLTGLLYACLAVFAGGWYFNKWSGNFSLLLFILSVVTFAYWLAERFVFLPRRRAAARAAEQRWEEEQRMRGGEINQGAREAVVQRNLLQPWWLDWTAGLFPVILAVFLLRSFLFEPFKIPSGSMKPTLLVGDLILVNKYHYGIRLPVINRKIVQLNDPQRGDVMVFRYPQDPSTDYIKRVVGTPGDEISFRGQKLYVNGEEQKLKQLGEFYDDDTRRYELEFSEQLGTGEHRILINPQTSPFFGTDESHQFPFHENCRYSAEGVTCKVPAGNYFMMGDNRDNSQDSRYWGFVPDENIVGKAFFVWMNFSDLKRIGPFR